jgi:hypothetical protein
MNATKHWTRRLYQKVALVAVRKVRCMVLFWARQCRKSTTLGDIAFDEMSRESGRNVIAASASLLTGSELVSKTLSSAEQASLVTREAAALQMTMNESSQANAMPLKCANSDTGKLYTNLSTEDFTDLYRSSRLEMRLYHNRTDYSRLRVIAPNPATARGWTGTVVRDEAGFTHPNLERDLQIAVKPIMDTDRTFKLIYASNLPRDDRHPFFEMTLPEPGMEFPPDANGHFYRGQNGILIHRVALCDAYAAGHVLYDTREGKPLTYDQFCADPANRLGLDESYRLIHKFGGAAAIDLFALTTAQRRGIGQCGFFFVENELEFQVALRWIVQNCTKDKTGIGCDVATTTNDTSNPTCVTVMQKRGMEYVEVAVIIWKEREPKVARERLARIIQAVQLSPAGGAQRFCIDATNEQYFARETAQELGSMIPFDLVNASNTVDPAPVGYARVPNFKTFLGDLYSAAINDNRMTLPSDDYLKEDHRLVVKSAGTYVCEPQADGKHGDTFDGGKLALHALDFSTGALTAETLKQIRIGAPATGRLGIFRPRILV